MFRNEVIQRGYKVPHDNEVLVLKGEPGEPGEIGLQGIYLHIFLSIYFYIL